MPDWEIALRFFMQRERYTPYATRDALAHALVYGSLSCCDVFDGFEQDRAVAESLLPDDPAWEDGRWDHIFAGIPPLVAEAVCDGAARGGATGGDGDED